MWRLEIVCVPITLTRNPFILLYSNNITSKSDSGERKIVWSLFSLYILPLYTSSCRHSYMRVERIQNGRPSQPHSLELGLGLMVRASIRHHINAIERYSWWAQIIHQRVSESQHWRTRVNEYLFIPSTSLPFVRVFMLHGVEVLRPQHRITGGAATLITALHH